MRLRVGRGREYGWIGVRFRKWMSARKKGDTFDIPKDETEHAENCSKAPSILKLGQLVEAATGEPQSSLITEAPGRPGNQGRAELRL